MDNLRDIPLQQTYDSDVDNVLTGFYIPSLSVALRYQRLAGFFSSSALAIAARGLASFVTRGGKMELLCAARLSKEDAGAINEGRLTPETALEHAGIRELANLQNDFVRDHVGALGWMVARGQLEVKVAVVLDDTGRVLSSEEVDEEALFHQKVGVLTDTEGNSLSFSGSDNETAAGWTRHVEEFKVFRSWVPAEVGFLESDKRKFAKFWENRGIRTRVYDVPRALRDHLLQIAPADFRNLKLDRWISGAAASSLPPLWPHQQRAVDGWFDHGMRGIFEMATGTGKTNAALECLSRSSQKDAWTIAVLSFPYSHLLQQWLDHFREMDFKAPTVTIDSTNAGWRSELADRILDLRSGASKRLVVFTTHNSLSSSDLTNAIQKASSGGLKTLLIVDEVHGIGSDVRRNGLLPCYDCRLGLSATPERWFDPEGTAVIRGFFGPTVGSFTLREAILTNNPATGQSFLTPYEYRPKFVELSGTEINEYVRLSQRISKLYFVAESDADAKQSLDLLLFQRQAILNNAAAKLTALREIVDEIHPVRYCLVYCSPEQRERVQSVLNDANVTQHKFTLEEGVVSSARYGGRSERQALLEGLADGKYQALVAIRCLDEGVDVPPARNGIILASTSNPREFIQRRGRLLRRAPGKEVAIIYDVICSPPIGTIIKSEDLIRAERKILEKETARFLEFAEDAKNQVECLDKLTEFERKQGVL